jgi:hypothetical protein
MLALLSFCPCTHWPQASLSIVNVASSECSNMDVRIRNSVKVHCPPMPMALDAHAPPMPMPHDAHAPPPLVRPDIRTSLGLFSRQGFGTLNLTPLACSFAVQGLCFSLLFVCACRVRVLLQRHLLIDALHFFLEECELCSGSLA